MKFRKLTYILLIILCTGFSNNSDSIAPFLNEYKYSIVEAHGCYADIKPAIAEQSELFGTDKTIIGAIVFPELVRYSKFRDFLETVLLEQLYTDGGTEAANFSIGMFQIKPSFVEHLENSVKSDTNLAIYNFISEYDSDNIKEIRKKRLDRIKTINWQMFYLNCFYSMMEMKFSDEIFRTTEEKVRFYATAYNHGYNCSASEIRKWQNIKTFPHGYKSKKKNYSYADISAYFYQQIKEEL
jgi:hypothetical protein